MAQRVDINVNVVDAAAKQKLEKWEYDTDKLRRTKVIIKFDADTGAATRQFARYTNDAGKVVDVNTQIKKSGQQVTTVTETTADATNKAGAAASKAAGQFTLLNTVFLRLAHTALSAVTRAFREALTEMKNVDTQLTVISRVTQTNIADLEKLKNKAYEVGSAYGVMASDYLSAAAAFSRAGYREQAEDLAELSSKLQVAGGVSADVANQFLIATDKAYQLNGSAKDLSDVMDKLTVIDHNYATSVEKIAEGMGLVAPIAKQANMSIDELIAAMGTITAVTQRSGSESARALRALILSIIKDTTTELDDGVTWTVEEINSIQDALKLYAPEVVKAAEATGSLIDPMEAIAALAKSYEDGLLTEAKLAELTNQLGGKLRASQLLSLIQNYSGMYTDMLNQMQTATGAVDADIEKSLESWEVKINQLKNTFTEFVQKSLSSDLFKGLLDSVKWLIEGFGDLGTAVAIFGGSLIALKIPAFAAFISKLAGNIGLFIMRVYSGVGANEAFAASFNGLSLSATAAKGAIGLITIAISAAVIAYNKYIEALDKTIERGEKAKDELKDLEELEESYNKLQSQYKNGEISQEQYAKGKDEVIKRLDEEGYWVDTVTRKYATLDDKIQGVITSSKEYKKIEIEDAIKALEEKYSGSPALWSGKGSYNANTSWANYYVNGGKNPFWTNAIHDNGGLEELVKIYDKAIERRVELNNDGSKEDERLRKFIEANKEIVEQYKELLNTKEELAENNSNSTNDIVEDLVEYINPNLLSTKLKQTKKVIDDFNETEKETTEHGELFKGYAEAYQKAVDLYAKGLTGTNKYKSTIELLFGNVADYEEAGKFLGNAFIKSLFEGGGDDYGVKAANYIREHLDEFKGVLVREANDGTFSVAIKDLDEFAESTGLTTDGVIAFIDALDGLDGSVTIGFSDELGGITKDVETLTTKLDGAVKALERYKQALSGGEKGDTFRSYADAYAKAMEMYEKGLTGTNAYIAAIDLLIPKDVLRELGYDYEAAGEYLKSKFFESAFSENGDDYALNLAQFIKDNAEAYSDYVDILQGEDGTWGLNIKNAEGLAKALNVQTDVIWAATDALDAYNSAATYTDSELKSILDKYGSNALISVPNNRNGEIFYNKLIEKGFDTSRIIGRTNKALKEADASFDKRPWGLTGDIVVTPVLPDGRVLTANELREYVGSILNGGEDIYDIVLANTDHYTDFSYYLRELGAAADEADSAITHLDLKTFIDNLVKDGKTEREIYQIVDNLRALAESDPTFTLDEPENLGETIDNLIELNKESEKDNIVKVDVESNADEVFDDLDSRIDAVDGTEIGLTISAKFDKLTGAVLGVTGAAKGVDKYKVAGDGIAGFVNEIVDNIGHHASGTKSAQGGLSLVNEEGAELIYANGKAWIAGGGDPTITNLPIGAGVFNAKETREIFSRSGINSSFGGLLGTSIVGLRDKENKNTNNKPNASTSLSSLINQLSEYIDEILKKAKEALEEQIKVIDEQIDKLKREHDAAEDANKLEELRLKILEAEKKLAEAENERTVRYFNKETGQWEWMADQKAVADAQKSLQDARDAYDKEVAEQAYQAQIQALEDQKDALNDAYSELSGSWDKILNALQAIVDGDKTINVSALLASLLKTGGKEYASDIENLIGDISNFTSSPLDSETTARILSANGGGAATSLVSALLGSSAYDLNAKGNSTSSGSSSTIVGDTIYYINGVQIGSDMMNKPLSQILSVLPIYAN